MDLITSHLPPEEAEFVVQHHPDLSSARGKPRRCLPGGGESEQEVVAPVRAGDVALPAALMRPVGRLHWFTDRNVAPVGAT